MSDGELEILLMGYLDGELDAGDRGRVEAALAEDPELRAELQAMRRLKRLTDAAAQDDATDAELNAFWNDVYNRLERHAGWVLLLLGFAGLFGACLYFFFASPSHWTLKVAGACAALGCAVLLWSVWRERRTVLPHDRYHKEVHR